MLFYLLLFSNNVFYYLYDYKIITITQYFFKISGINEACEVQGTYV